MNIYRHLSVDMCVYIIVLFIRYGIFIMYVWKTEQVWGEERRGEDRRGQGSQDSVDF